MHLHRMIWSRSSLLLLVLTSWLIRPIVSKRSRQRTESDNSLQLATWKRTEEAKRKRKINLRREQRQHNRISSLNAEYALLSVAASASHSTPQRIERFSENSRSFPHQRLSYIQFNESTIGLPIPRRQVLGNEPCSFVGAVCGMEAVEHALVQQFIHPNDAVLELGARFGTTSCMISYQLRNSGKLISVEPDQSVWNLIDENRRRHRCNFWLLRGVVGYSAAITVSAAGAAGGGSMYATRTRNVPQTAKDINKLGYRSYTFAQIQNETGIAITALLIDCEGCIEQLFRHDPAPIVEHQRHHHTTSEDSYATTLVELLQGVHTIILEGDMPLTARDCKFNCVNYTLWEQRFNAAGLRTIQKQPDPIYHSIVHYVFQR